jgi:hypothetical protein
LLLALVLGVSALQASLTPPPFPPPTCQPGVGICKICGCSRCPICPICCSQL